jgi:hypothetical protein
MAESKRHSPRYAWLTFAFVLCAYVCCASREQPWGDGLVMYQVAESLARSGEISVPSEWPPMSHRGSDGKIYSQFAPLPSLVHVPGVWLLDAITGREDEEALSVWWPLTCHLGMSVCAAGASGVLVSSLLLLGFRPRVAVATAMVLAFATALAVYARQPYSEPLQALTAISLLRAAQSLLRNPSRRTYLCYGAVSGLMIASKLVFLPGVVLASVWLLFQIRTRARPADVVGWGLIGVAPVAALILSYNRARWGSPFLTGYEESFDFARESVFVGLFGLLFSPGKSIFLFSPPLVLAVFGMRRFVTRARAEAAFVLIVVVTTTLIYSRFLNWVGGWCWGPRHLVFALPMLMPSVAYCLAVSDGARLARLRSRVLCTAIIFVGLTVQVLGASFYWDHYIRIGKRVGFAWLGEPDRSGAAIPERGRGHCDACFEDMHGLVWLPPLQPILGHSWLFLAHASDASWAQAADNAPWARYTTLRPDVSKYYHRARFDWWVLHMRLLRPGVSGPGWFVFGITSLGLLSAGVLLARGLRHARKTVQASTSESAVSTDTPQ